MYVYGSMLSLSHTHTHHSWSGQSRPGSAAGQPVPLHISVIHPCHSGQDHEGGVEWWMEGKARLTFNPHAVALCSPIASSREHPPPPLLLHTPSLLYHLSPQAPVPAPPAWVSAKEDTWQRTDRPKAAWTPSDLARERKRKGTRMCDVKYVRMRELKECNLIGINFKEISNFVKLVVLIISTG